MSAPLYTSAEPPKNGANPAESQAEEPIEALSPAVYIPAGDELRFIVPGRPITWQRPTDDRRSGRRNVTSAEQRKEKRRIAMLARAALPPGWPTDAEYAIEVIGYWPDRRFGDVDRLVSLTMDALEGVAYRADRQVSVQCGGRLLDRDRPRVEVVLCALRASETASVNILIGATRP